MNRLLRTIYIRSRKKNIKLAFPSFIGKGVKLEGNNFIGRFCHLSNTSIGNFSYIGNGCEFANCRIGSFCSISSDVRVIIGSHPSSKWISTHPLFFSRNSYVGKGFVDKARYEEYKKTTNGYSCEIGNDVWIGRNVNIMQGVTIGNGAIIGSNSLVTRDIAPYSIVVGIPAHELRKRFNDNEIDFLEKVEWWKWDIGRLKMMSLYFNDINEFRQHL